MASQTALTTPSSSRTLSAPPAAPPPPPGTWEHPKLAEISRRRLANVFDEDKLKVVLISTLILGLTFISPPFSISFLNLSPTLLSRALLLFRLSLVINALIALLPLFRQPDDISDIPLSPSQRALLGLGPSSAPATPTSSYITPPRYSRSTSRPSSSRAATHGSNRSLSSSGFGSSIGVGATGGSPASASASPLVRKVVGKRASFGGSGTAASRLGNLGNGSSEDVFGTGASPSPGGQRTVSVALNNKWLYKRRNGSPGGMSSYI